VTSAVSALSGFVANGHQALRHVSATLSKIPYGGFSPVRLQTGSLSRGLRSAESHRRLIPRPMAPPPWYPGSPALCRAGHGSANAFRSRGPWLGSGLFCPGTSSLTMASSEPLVLSRRLALVGFDGGSLPAGLSPEGPQFEPRVFRSVPLPLPRRSGGDDCSKSTRDGLRLMLTGSASANLPPEVGSRRGYVSGLTAVRSSLRPGSLLALHRQGRLRSSFRAASRLAGTSNMTTRPDSQLPRPDFHRRDTQPCGLH
jgi:hypothetical protein